MIKEIRFKGISPQGKLVQGTFSASTNTEVKKHLHRLSDRYQIKIQSIENKKSFNYKVKLPMGKFFTGRQSSFTKEEVAQALQRMGYTDFTISPVLFDIKIKPSANDVMMFIKLSTNMLKDKMSFGKILSMLAEEQTNRRMREALIQIEGQLKQGAEGREVFVHYTDIFGKFPAFMLGLATRSGNMTEIFEATNKFIERDMEIKKNAKKAIISPMFAVLPRLAQLFITSSKYSPLPQNYF